jgi:hypothetical protein
MASSPGLFVADGGIFLPPPRLTFLSFSGAGDFTLTWQLVPTNPNAVEFTMTATTTGWVSMGFSDGTPAHQKADMVVGSVSGGTCTVVRTLILSCCFLLRFRSLVFT